MQANGRECVVGVVGKLPVGALSLKRARKSDSHDLIVSSKAYPKKARFQKAKKSKKKAIKRRARRVLRKASKRAKRSQKPSRK